MIWRLRMHRLRRSYDRVLRIAGRIGTVGTAVVAGGSAVLPMVGIAHPLPERWLLLLLGVCLALAGIGYALVGDAPTLQEYAYGDGEEMPAITKLIGGLLASTGGVAMCFIGIMNF